MIYGGKPFVLGALCARSGSKGVPRKALAMVGGVTLLETAILHLRESRAVSQRVLSTDGAFIAEEWIRCGEKGLILDRPAHLASDSASKWPVFRDVVERVERETGERVDVLVDLDVGCPFRLPIHIDQCVETLLESAYDVVATAYESDRNPYFNMVVPFGDAGYRVAIPLPGERVVARQAAPPVFSLSPAVFAIRRDSLWSCEHWSAGRLGIHVVSRTSAMDIDSLEDLVIARAIAASQGASQ